MCLEGDALLSLTGHCTTHPAAFRPPQHRTILNRGSRYRRRTRYMDPDTPLPNIHSCFLGLMPVFSPVAPPACSDLSCCAYFLPSGELSGRRSTNITAQNRYLRSPWWFHVVSMQYYRGRAKLTLILKKRMRTVGSQRILH